MPDTTTTTLVEAVCGDVNDDGTLSAADALGVLRASVGTADCQPWECDYDGSGEVSASDALEVLRAAIGDGAPPECPSRS